jgi:nucleotide-binding universal stress UspA family protein
MSERPWTTGPPGSILLATDLSARCDRAFDRAVQLAQAWGAKLTVATVIEGPRTPDELDAWVARESDTRESFLRKQLTRDLAGLDVSVEVAIGEGDVASAIGDVVAASDCGLVVTGMARNEAFGRFLVGATVERLARMLAPPLLVVRNRVRHPYKRILVATDFSGTSRYALQTAVQLFPHQRLRFYHAHGVRERRNEERTREAIVREIAESGLTPEETQRLEVVVERGEVEIALPRYVRAHDIDLAIIGTRGRSHLMNVLLGRSAARLVEWLPCDTMLVRQPRAGV